MSAAKARPAEGAAPAKRSRRRVLLTLVAAGAFAGAGYGASEFVARHVITAPQFKFDSGNVYITPLPNWIHSDLKTEALHAGSLSGKLSVLDASLAERIAKAFGLHPWVKKVVRVRLTNPAGAEVDVVYRKPACMVEVPGGLYPVDDEAVLLPTADFSALEATKFPRLSGIQTVTEGPVGTTWHDARVLGAAMFGAALLTTWEEMKFGRIVPSSEAGRPLSSAECEYELFTKGGTRILWGHAPGAAPTTSAEPKEPTVEEKLARLRKYAALRGGLDGAISPEDIDVRSPGDLTTIPRAAASTADSSDTQIK